MSALQGQVPRSCKQLMWGRLDRGSENGTSVSALRQESFWSQIHTGVGLGQALFSHGACVGKLSWRIKKMQTMTC